MTIELRSPTPGEEPRLRALFTEAFEKGKRGYQRCSQKSR